MQIVFTLNVTEVRDHDGNVIPTTDEHYKQTVEAFKEDQQDIEHEAIIGPSITAMYEMQDVALVCDICNTWPCCCE